MPRLHTRKTETAPQLTSGFKGNAGEVSMEFGEERFAPRAVILMMLPERREQPRVGQQRLVSTNRIHSNPGNWMTIRPRNKTSHSNFTLIDEYCKQHSRGSFPPNERFHPRFPFLACEQKRDVIRDCEY